MAVSGISSFNTPLMVSSDVGSIALADRDQGIYVTSTKQASRLPENTTYREFEEDLHRTVGIAIRSLKHSAPAVKEFVKFALKNAAMQRNDDVS